MAKRRSCLLLLHGLLMAGNCSAFTIGPRYHRRTISLLKSTKLEQQLDEALKVDLPIMEVLPQVRQSLADRPNLLLEAPPGAGKTTVIPLALLQQQQQQHENNILVVEPRRVAARSAAQRMASMLGQSPGQIVGYAMRGEARLSSQTRVTVVTDGVLLNKLREDPSLEGVDIVVFDEFHERGVDSDTALALSVEAQRQLRPDLGIVVMSATLLGNDTEDEESTGSKLVRCLGGQDECTVVRSDGRQFPIEVQWMNQLSSIKQQPLGALITNRALLVDTMCDAIEVALQGAPAKGDVLAFLPGVAEIRRTVQKLKEARVDAEILPLYGALPKDQQDNAIYPSSDAGRRVIVATPIAEASLTLERVTCVVDSGLRREPRCDVDTGMPRLVTTRCSKASATQRAGRAGRVQEGMCLRLYTQSEFEDRFSEQSPPEIKSTDLAPTALLLSDWGCSTTSEILNDLPFVDTPDEPSLEKAFQLLIDLQAIERNSQDRLPITSHGQEIARMPTHPRIATTIARSASNKSTLVAAVTAAYLLDDDVGVRGGSTPDLAPRVRELLEGASAKQVLKYATRISEAARDAVQDVLDSKLSVQDVTLSLGRALLPGFVDLVAERKSDASYGGSTYMLSLGRSARLDGIRDASEYVVVVDTSTGDDGVARIRGFCSISKEALLEVAVERDVVFTVPSRGHEVRARRVLMVGSSLELSSNPLPTPGAEEVAKVLRETIWSLGGVNAALLQSLPPDRRKLIQDLRGRVRFAQKLSSSSSEWPSCFSALDAEESGSGTAEEARVLEELVEPWLAASGSLKKVSLLEALQGCMTPAQQQELERDYPTHLAAPDGTRIPVSYTSTGTPMASAKLQQFFGTVDSPSIGPSSNRMPISLSLLSPAGKPLAQTLDLPFFWKEAYPSVRAEMRGRYAKHPWPEDPLTAVATRKTKKQQERTSGDGSEKARPAKKKRGKKRR